MRMLLKKSLKFFSFLLITFCLFFSSDVYASCMFSPPTTSEVVVNKIVSPVYNSHGNVVEGCLLISKDTVLGYAQTADVCKLELNKKHNLKLSNGCCDTGPDNGDRECIVRSKSPVGTAEVHGNGIKVSLPK